MSNSLLAKRHDHAIATPVTRDHAHIIDRMDPTWGLYPGLVPDALADLAFRLPSLDVLRHMQEELERALIPCRDMRGGLNAAVEAAQVLIDSYPAQDRSKATYAEQLVLRLGECPSDLLPKVVQQVVDECVEFRPSPGKIKQHVQRETAKRWIILQKTKAAIRWWEHQHRLAEWREEPKAKVADSAILSVLDGIGRGGRHAEQPRHNGAPQRAPRGLSEKHLKAARKAAKAQA